MLVKQYPRSRPILRQEVRGLDLGFVAPIAVAVVLAVVLGIGVLAPIRDDVAWLLYVAEAWLDGQRPYATLIEVNPPTIIWLSLVPVLLARGLGANVLLVAPLFFTACILGCAWLCATMLARRGTFREPRTVFAVLSAVLLLLPAFEFYQREHLIAAGALPFLAIRTGTLRATTAESVVCGVLVGLCCSMKPHFVLCFAAVEVVAFLRGQRPAYGAILAALATGLLCLAAAALLTPDYFRVVVPLALDLYLPSLHGDLVNRTTVPVLLAWVTALLLLISHRRRLADGGTTAVLVAFATGSVLVYALQGKGWFYQVLPAGFASVLAIASWIATVRSGPGWRRAAMPVAALVLVLVTGKAVLQLRRAAELAVTPGATLEARLAEAIRSAGATRYVAYATKLSRGFPVVQMAGVEWASRFPSTWALEAEQHRLGTNTLPPDRGFSVAGAMAHDFVANCPGLVAVEEGGPVDAPVLLAAADPAFKRTWARYRPAGRVEGLQLYRPGAGACD